MRTMGSGKMIIFRFTPAVFTDLSGWFSWPYQVALFSVAFSLSSLIAIQVLLLTSEKTQFSQRSTAFLSWAYECYTSFNLQKTDRASSPDLILMRKKRQKVSSPSMSSVFLLRFYAIKIHETLRQNKGWYFINHIIHFSKLCYDGRSRGHYSFQTLFSWSLARSFISFFFFVCGHSSLPNNNL